MAPLAGSALLPGLDQTLSVPLRGRPASTAESGRAASEMKVPGDSGQLVQGKTFSRDQSDTSWPRQASPFCLHRPNPSGAALQIMSIGKRATPEPLFPDETLAGPSRGAQPATVGETLEAQPNPTTDATPLPTSHLWRLEASYPPEIGEATRRPFQNPPALPLAAEEKPWPEEKQQSRTSERPSAERTQDQLPPGMISGPGDQHVQDNGRQCPAWDGDRLLEASAPLVQDSRRYLEIAAPGPRTAPSPPQTLRDGDREGAQPLPEPSAAAAGAPIRTFTAEAHGGAGFEPALQLPRVPHGGTVIVTEQASPMERRPLVATLRGLEKPAAAAAPVGTEDKAEHAEPARFPAKLKPSSSSPTTSTGGEMPDWPRADAASLPAMSRFRQDSLAPEVLHREPSQGPHHLTQRWTENAAAVAEDETRPTVPGENLERRPPATPGASKAAGAGGGPGTGMDAPPGLGEGRNAEVLRSAGADPPGRAGTTHSAPAARREEAPSSGTLARISSPEPPAGGAAVHALRVTLADEHTGRRVHVLLASSGGEVSLRLRTADPALRREIHEDLPRLAQRLDEAGYRPLSAGETDAPPLEQRFRGKENGNFQDQEQRQTAGGEERGESDRRRTRQQWMEAFEAAKD